MKTEGLRRLRVLVADDHPAVVRAVSRLLALTFEVAGSVADGGALLEAAQRLRPDVIVLDVNLPSIDGLTACRQITQAHPEMKVVMFTALDDPELRRRALEAGASALVHKLSLDDSLLSTLKHLDGNRG